MKRFVRVLPLDPKYFEPGLRYKLERYQDERNCSLVEEIVWPEKVNDPDAHHIRDTIESMCLTPDQQRWLYTALGEMLAEQETEDEDEDENAEA